MAYGLAEGIYGIYHVGQQRSLEELQPEGQTLHFGRTPEVLDRILYRRPVAPEDELPDRSVALGLEHYRTEEICGIVAFEVAFEILEYVVVHLPGHKLLKLGAAPLTDLAHRVIPYHAVAGIHLGIAHAEPSVPFLEFGIPLALAAARLAHGQL